MITLSMIMHFLGGIGLFLYGVNTTADGLQKIAANKLKSILQSLTKNTWTATLFGIIMTVALQSSAATTVLVVEFVNSGLMTLVQALGVSLGSSVGTFLVIQLISFPVLDVALFLIFIGFISLLIVRTQLARQIGQTLIGFGCIFVGMAYLSGAFAPLKNAPEVSSFLSSFGSNQILGIIAGILFTALLQNSTAFLAILISLSGHDLLTLEAILPLVMGAHIGGTLTTLISSLGAERVEAKRVAVANSMYRILAAVLLLPFFPYFGDLVRLSTEELPQQVANTYLFSSVFMLIAFLPFNGPLARMLTRLIPGHKSKAELSAKYITKGALEVPTVALSQAHQELRWLAYNILENMLQILPRVFSSGDSRWVAEFAKAERQVDWHYTQLSDFLGELFRRNMTREQIVESLGLQLAAKELEDISDSLTEMASLGQTLHSGKLAVETSNWIALEELYYAISDNYLALLRYMEKWDQSMGAGIVKSHEQVIESYNKLQGNMTCQIGEEGLSDGQKVILELGNWFYKLGEHIVSIVRFIK